MRETEPINIKKQTSPKEPVFDAEKFKPLLMADNPNVDIPDKQAEEFLRFLWGLAESCADYGWGLSVVQYFVDELSNLAEDSGDNSVKLIEQKHNTNTFNQNASATNVQEE